MDSLIRRRGMKEEAEQGVVYAWDHTMGLPEDIGWTRYSSKNTETVTLEDDGMRVSITDSSSVFWAPPVETCTSGWAEFTVIPVSFTGNGAWNNLRGISLFLSDGAKGFRICFRMVISNIYCIQHRYNTGTASHNMGNFFDSQTLCPYVENYVKVGNNIDGNTIGSIPSVRSNVLRPNQTYTKTGYDFSKYQTIRNQFGLDNGGECIFVSAKFTILESEELV